MKITLINRTQGTPIKVPIVLETPEEFELPLSAGVSNFNSPIYRRRA